MSHRVLGALFVLGATLIANVASADSRQCVADNEQANQLRQKGKFKDARQKLLACAAAECPKIVREECQVLVGKVEASIPTVVFSAVDAGGNDVADVRVFIDDEKVTDRLSGRAVELDPGEHRLRFETNAGQRVERTLIAHEGEKNRPVKVELDRAESSATKSAPRSAPTGQSEPSSTVKKGPPAIAYVLGGVGVVGLGAFGYFAVKGKQQENDLESRCAPNCEQSEADAMHRKYLIADIALGIGLLSLAGATYFFVSAGPAPGGAHASISTRF